MFVNVFVMFVNYHLQEKTGMEVIWDGSWQKIFWQDHRKNVGIYAHVVVTDRELRTISKQWQEGHELKSNLKDSSSTLAWLLRPDRRRPRAWWRLLLQEKVLVVTELPLAGEMSSYFTYVGLFIHKSQLRLIVIIHVTVTAYSGLKTSVKKRPKRC